MMREKTLFLITADYNYSQESNRMQEVERKTVPGDTYIEVLSFCETHGQECKNVRAIQ